ncbi:MAG: hypothetical protein RL291_1039, partial [Pseudomonadota bacterium]
RAAWVIVVGALLATGVTAATFAQALLGQPFLR